MTTSRPAAVIVLAAGEGTRMKSDLPKVLHTIGGRSLLGHAIAAARALDPVHLTVVVRHERDRVAAHIRECDPDCVVADQDEVKGTGRAVECGLEALPPDLAGTVVVTYGDVPLLSGDTLRDVVRAHEGGQYAVTVVTTEVADPAGYGRIVRDADGLVAFDATLLRAALAQLTTDNAQGEKYVTDVLGIARSGGARVGAFVLADYWQCEGVNDKVQLARLGAELNRRTVESAMRAGAIVVDPATTWIDADVSVGTDTVIHPNSQVLGATTIGAGAVIGPDTTLRDMEVGDGASVVRTHAELSVVGAGCTVGPWAHLRPGTELGPDSVVRSFVETKNVVAAAGSVIPQLTYVGDTMIEAQAAGPGE